MPPTREPIVIREFDDTQNGVVLDAAGQTQEPRIIRLHPFKTGYMQRVVDNALIEFKKDGSFQGHTGNQAMARRVAAIQSWQGPAWMQQNGQYVQVRLEKLPVSIETLDALEIDDFMERVFEEVQERFGAKPKETEDGPKALKSGTLTSGRTTIEMQAEPTSLQFSPAPGQTSTSTSEPELVGSWINWIDHP